MIEDLREFVLRLRMAKEWGKPYAVHWLSTSGGIVEIWAKDWAPPIQFKGRTVTEALRAAIEHKEKT